MYMLIFLFFYLIGILYDKFIPKPMQDNSPLCHRFRKKKKQNIWYWLYEYVSKLDNKIKKKKLTI